METAQGQDQAQAQPQRPLCPVCHKSDQIKRLQAAYETGIERLAPPKMPASTAAMSGFIMVSVGLVAVGVFFILVMSAAGAYGFVPQVIQAVLTLLAIVAALVLSLIAILRIVRSDNETVRRYPVWDRAMAAWRRLYYCSRDNVVFDPQQGKVVSDQALQALLRVDEAQNGQATTATAGTSHS